MGQKFSALFIFSLGKETSGQLVSVPKSAWGGTTFSFNNKHTKILPTTALSDASR